MQGLMALSIHKDLGDILGEAQSLSFYSAVWLPTHSSLPASHSQVLGLTNRSHHAQMFT